MGRNHRSIRNFLIRPRKQLKMVYILAILGIVSSITIIISVTYFVWQIVPGIIQECAFQNSVGTHTVFLPLLYFISAICLVSTMFTLAIGIIYSHRIYGSIVPILRQINALKEGNYSDRGRLRRGDELDEIMKALNDLASGLEDSRRS